MSCGLRSRTSWPCWLPSCAIRRSRHAAQEITFTVGVERGEFTQAEAALGRWQAIAEELGQPTLRWLSTQQHAGLELLRGHLAAGERLAEQAARIGQESHPVDVALVYGAQLSFVRRYQGRAEEIVDRIEQNISAHPAIAALTASLAAVFAMIGRYGDASSLLEQAASDRFEHVSPSVSMLATLALYADVAAQTRDVQSAGALYERMEPFSDQIVFLGGARLRSHTALARPARRGPRRARPGRPAPWLRV